MSPQQQAGILRSLVVKKLKQARVLETMVDTLRRTNTIASGTLASRILSKEEASLIKINYKINKELGVIYDIVIRYNRGLKSWGGDETDPVYALTVDTTYGQGPIDLRPPRHKITQWIYKKLGNGTWEGPREYIVTRHLKSGSKTYRYPLQDGRYRKKLAYVIQQSIIKRKELLYRSPYITAGEFQVTDAIFRALDEFGDLYQDNIANRVETVLESTF